MSLSRSMFSTLRTLPLSRVATVSPRQAIHFPRAYSTLPGTGKTPLQRGKSDSFLKNIPIEVSPLILAISGVICIATGALIRHMLNDEDLRLIPHQKGLIDDNDEALKKALATPSPSK